jgi:arylsulfatase A-like enzyme
LGSEEFHPEHQGFDWQIGVSNYGQPMSYYSPYKKKFRGELLKMQSLQNNIRPEEYLTDRLGREAVQFIQQHQKEPFFLQLSFYAVHTPIQPPKEEKHYFDHKLKGEHHKNEAYAAMIKKTDENIGRVLQSLEALDLEENTLVIVTSDNGGFLNVTKNIGIRKGKGYAYEGGVKVPMWMKWPNKIKKGVSFDSPVSSIDIMPTILGSLQIDISKSTSMDGVNLMDQITLNKTLDRDLFWHFPHFRGGDIVPYTMVRSGDYKLIKRYKGKEFELFNLAQDPEEKTDLSEKQTDKVEVLNNRIEIWLKQTQASIPLQ